MGFSTIDYLVLVAYLIGITLFGMQFRRSQRTVRDYFIGRRTTSWIVISLSIVAAETSTLTVIGVPAQMYANYAHPEQGGAFNFLQVVIGYILARFVIAFLLIPRYFQGQLMTAYALLETRFGVTAKHVAASLFLVMRSLAEGVRVFAASLVLSAVIGASLPNLPNLWFWSVLLVGLLTLVYTFEGGIGAVIWTDLIQLTIYIAGSLLAAYEILQLVPGGWTEIVSIGREANKLQLWSFSWDLSLPFTFWAGVIGGTFLTMASHGTDQLLVQRVLTCRNQRDGQKALIMSGFVVLFQFVLFLTIGLMLFAYYRTHAQPVMTSTDQIFPVFIVNTLPHGISGLVIAAIFAAAMSNLSASLNSLASTTVLDFYAPMSGGNKSDVHLLKVSRWVTAAWGIVLILVALLARTWGSVFTAGLTIASIVYGPMLGAFALGVFTTRATTRGVITGMAVSLGSMWMVWFRTSLAWTWYVLLGCAICVSVGYVVSLAGPKAARASA